MQATSKNFRRAPWFVCGDIKWAFRDDQTVESQGGAHQIDIERFRDRGRAVGFDPFDAHASREGGQLSVAGFDNFGLAMCLYPAMSTAALPLMSMAVAATRQVRETLDGRPVTASQQLTCDVVLRESIGKAVGN